MAAEKWTIANRVFCQLLVGACCLLTALLPSERAEAASNTTVSRPFYSPNFSSNATSSPLPMWRSDLPSNTTSPPPLFDIPENTSDPAEEIAPPSQPSESAITLRLPLWVEITGIALAAAFIIIQVIVACQMASARQAALRQNELLVQLAAYIQMSAVMPARRVDGVEEGNEKGNG